MTHQNHIVLDLIDEYFEISTYRIFKTNYGAYWLFYEHNLEYISLNLEDCYNFRNFLIELEKSCKENV